MFLCSFVRNIGTYSYFAKFLNDKVDRKERGEIGGEIVRFVLKKYIKNNDNRITRNNWPLGNLSIYLELCVTQLIFPFVKLCTNFC